MNQIWQRGLPNSYNDSDGILNKIQIPPEWFWESPGRNAQEQNPFLHCLQRQHPKPYFPSTTIIVHNDHPARHIATLTNGHHHPWSSPTALNYHCRTQMQQRHTYATMFADTSHSKRAPTRTTPTTTVVHNDRPSSPHRHSHQQPPPSTVFTHRPQQQLHAPDAARMTRQRHIAC